MSQRRGAECNALFSYWWNCGRIVCDSRFRIFSNSVTFASPEVFVQYLERTEHPRPTHYTAVPTVQKAILLYLLARAESGSTRAPAKPSNALRFVRYGAAHMSSTDCIELSHALGGVPLLPTYSMSECMPIASPPLHWSDTDHEQYANTVGKPLTSVKVAHIETGKALPFNEIGEILIKGPVNIFLIFII